MLLLMTYMKTPRTVVKEVSKMETNNSDSFAPIDVKKEEKERRRRREKKQEP